MISDNSKQIGFNLSTYDSISHTKGTSFGGAPFFNNDRNYSSFNGFKGSNEPMIKTGTKTIMGGFHRNSQTFFGGEADNYYKSTAVNFNSSPN